MISIRFLPEGKIISVKKNSNLLESALKNGVDIRSSCGGEGVCGKCVVRILKGEYGTMPNRFISREQAEKGYVLACTTQVNTDAEVEIIEVSEMDRTQILTESKTGVAYPLSPVVKTIRAELSPSSLQDMVADYERLKTKLKESGIEKTEIFMDELRTLDKKLLSGNWKVDVVLCEEGDKYRILKVEKQIEKTLGVVIDIGTTTVVVEIIDTANGESIGIKARGNSQAKYGEDVISRIMHASEKKGLEELNKLIMNDIDFLAEEIIKEKRINREDIYAVSVAGNPTMMQLFLKINPKYIRKEPYVPTTKNFPALYSGEIGIGFANDRIPVYVLPLVASYIGGDTTGGVVSSGLFAGKKLSMLLDLGTNGEIVVGNNEFLACCACSCGPAFEGSGIKHGMRASRGAIQKAEIDGKYDVKIHTIGNAKPRGICGSGLIELLGEMLKAGIIDKAGKIDGKIKSERIKEGEEGPEYVVAFAKETAITTDITITQPDIDNVIRSKGAVYSGASYLINKLGYKFSDLETLFIAGGFGNFLDVKNAKRIGLLPDIPEEKIKFIGNASISGARIYMLSKQAREDVRKVAKMMTYFELSSDNKYTEELTSALFLPHTNADLWKSY